MFRWVLTASLVLTLIFLFSNPSQSYSEESPYKLPYPAGKVYKVTQGNFGALSHNAKYKEEYAFDFNLRDGDLVVASRAGKVLKVKDNSNTGGDNEAFIKYANYIVIDHQDGTSALYLHLQYKSVIVKEGDWVEQGQEIAKADSTGYITGAHLHFQVQETPKYPWQWHTQSIQISFSDKDVLAKEPDGIPKTGKSYISDNKSPTPATFNDPFAYCAAVSTIDTPDEKWTGPAVPEIIREFLVQKYGSWMKEEEGIFWRCFEGKVLVCWIGANRPCGKPIDVDPDPQWLSKLESYCQDNPNHFIPFAVTGHYIIYDWQCQEGKPVAVRQVFHVDERGFIAEFWQEVPPSPVACPPQGEPKFSQGQEVITTDDGLRVREEPSLAAEIIKTQPKGTSGKILEGPVCADDYVWWRVEYEDGTIGWSAENWLEIRESQFQRSYCCDFSKPVSLRETTKYGIFGDDNFDTVVCGYLKIKSSNAYFVIVDFLHESFIRSIEEGIRIDNSVNIKENGFYLFNLGCLENGAIISIADIDAETQKVLLDSSPEKLVSIILSFEKHPGRDCECCCLAKKISLY